MVGDEDPEYAASPETGWFVFKVALAALSLLLLLALILNPSI